MNNLDTSLKKSTRAFSAGFTLVEVMVALAIVATALPALILLVMAQLDGAAHVREKTYAMWIAENELTRLNILNNKVYFPTYKLPEKDSGSVQMMGLQWQWQLEASKDERVPILVKVDIGVKFLGVAEGSGYTGVKETDDIDPIAVLTGYLNE